MMNLSQSKAENEDPASPNLLLERLLALPSYYGPVANWAGDRVAFYSDKTGRIELYLLDLDTRQVRQLSRGEVPRSVRSALCWSRDDREVIFGKDSAGDEMHDLYAIDVQTGEVRQFTANPAAIEFPVECSPDNCWLSALTTLSGQLNLWKVRLDGADYTALTDYPNPVLTGGNWSPDGGWLAYNVNLSEDMLNFDGYIVSADGHDTRRVLRVREGSEDMVGDWHPGGQLLAVTSDATGLHRPGILDLPGGEVRWLGTAEDAGIDETAGRFSPDGRWLACERNHQAQVRTVLYEVESGQRRELKLPPGQAQATDWVLNSRALLIYLTTEAHRPERGLYWLDTDRYETLLPAEYGALDPARFVGGQHLYYSSPDGLAIPALLYHPPRLPVDKKLPAVIVVHGGPTDQFFRAFDPFVQVLVGQGYVVLEPNIRGSTGYGVAFRDAALRDWGGRDLEDLVAGAKYLQSLPYVDPARLAIFGGSYGGYMTYMALTRHVGLFKAGVAWAGITDLPALYEDVPGHFKYYLRQQMGDPHENAALWHDRSALNFAPALQAQLLMLQGENDPRCPLSQASAFRDRLLELGRRENEDFEYVVLTAEGHGSEDTGQKIRVFKLLVDFLRRKL